MNVHHRILVVDDEPMIRRVISLTLTEDGYDVTTAVDGFDALLQLKTMTPEIVISDLNMPQMSGFEFLSIMRRRFPDILVVAMSAAYNSGDQIPGGVIADAFHPKGIDRPQDLLRIVADLIRNRAERALNHRCQSPPVWIPRNGKDSQGVPFIVVTCTECLRCFPLSVVQEDLEQIRETACLFCQAPVHYIIDFSLSVAAPGVGFPAERTLQQAQLLAD
jgi:CheY-like chemotaxis protein